MLPICSDNGSRLAAILPTCLTSIADSQGFSAVETLATALGVKLDTFPPKLLRQVAELPRTTSSVIIVVDGLGTANLSARASHARTLTSLKPKRIETVIPSTTGAALTTLTTGRLPGAHGLLGYQIRHPELGLVSTLKGWDGIRDTSSWQRETPLFAQATRMGMKSVAIGRPSHASGGFTASILAGAEYHSGQTIADRFALASQLVRGPEPVFAYLYVDELDKAAHARGALSDAWAERLEQFDSALDGFLNTLPGGVGVVITADHGIVDIPEHKQIVLDQNSELNVGVEAFGGEPRLRSIYLQEPAVTETHGTKFHVSIEEVVHRYSQFLGKRAWVGTREEAIAAGWFGDINAEAAARLGDVIIAARGQYSFILSTDSVSARSMVGQHGGISEDERGVPVALAGCYANSNLTAVITHAALL